MFYLNLIMSLAAIVISIVAIIKNHRHMEWLNAAGERLNQIKIEDEVMRHEMCCKRHCP